MEKRLLLHLILHLGRLVEERVRTELAGSGVSHEQARYLDAIAFHPRATISQLAQHLFASQPASTTMVSRLEALGFARRQVEPRDARATTVVLTPAGKAAHAAVRKAWGRAEDALTAGLPPDTARQLHILLRERRDRLGGISERADLEVADRSRPPAQASALGSKRRAGSGRRPA